MRSKFLTFIIISFFCFAFQVNAQQWLIYDASVLPDENDPAFIVSNTNNPPDTSTWIIDDPVIGGNKIAKFLTPGDDSRTMWALDPVASDLSNGITVMFRVKAFDYGVYDRIFELDLRPGDIADGVRDKVIIRSATRIQLENSDENNEDLERLQNWHTYRVTYFDSVTTVYLDEDPVAVVTGKSESSNTSDYIRWGDGSGSSTYGGLLDWFIWDTTGAYAPGEGAAIPEDLFVDQVDEQVAHWKFDETSGDLVTDEFGNSNGTLINGGDSVWVAGWDGNAIDFAKAVDSAYIEVPDNDVIEFDSTQSFTISMLIKADPVGNQNEQQIILKGAFGVDAELGWEGKWYGMQFKGGEVRIAVDDNVTKTQLGAKINSIWPSNRWAHLVGVRDKDDDMLKLYLNGQLIAEMEDATEGDIASGDLPVLMGLNHTGERPLDGQLDDLQIFNYALGADEIEDLFDSYGIEEDVLLAHWKFDETTGTTASDELGMSDGTLMYMPDTVWVPGWDGNALDFTKAPDTAYVIVADNNILEFDSTQSFSISMLLNIDPVGNQNEQQIILKGAFGVNEELGWEGKWYGMQIKGGELRIAVDDNVNKTQLGVNVVDIYPSRTWAHVVGVRDRAVDMLKLYLNGELIGELEDATEGDITSGDLPVLMGLNHSGERPLDGMIDELQIFNYALNEYKIQEMYEAYGVPSALAAYWEFDETSGASANDEVGPSDAKLVNMGGDSVWVAGHWGNAIDFSIAVDSAYIEVPDNENIEFDSTESFSISMLIWADPVNNTNEQQIILKGAFGVDTTLGWEGKWYGMQFKGGEARIAVDDNVNKTQLGVVVTDIWTLYRWNHLVGVRDLYEDSLKLYLNGELIGSMKDATEGDIASGDLPILIGLNHTGERPLDGKIDDLQIYNYALSPAKIQSLYDAYGEFVPIESNDNVIPVSYKLKQNYPNPFNPITNIEFHLAQPGKTTLTIYNTLGQKVATLINQNLGAGVHKATFKGNSISSGIYFYKLESGDFVQVKKMVLIK